MSAGGAHIDANDPFQKRAAVSMAIYTVGLALANMLTNQARTQALLTSNQATDKWSFFQAKSTKQTVMKAEGELLMRLAPAPNMPAGSNEEALAKLKAEVDRYDTEKADIQKEAIELADHGKHLEHKEHFYEYSATIVELGIVLAGVSLLMHSKKLLGVSAAVALTSFAVLGYTYFFVH